MTVHFKQDAPDTSNRLDTMKQGVLGKPVSRKEGLAKVKSANFERILNAKERLLAQEIHEQTESMRTNSNFLKSVEERRHMKRKEREERIARIKARKRQRK